MQFILIRTYYFILIIFCNYFVVVKSNAVENKNELLEKSLKDVISSRSSRTSPISNSHNLIVTGNPSLFLNANKGWKLVWSDEFNGAQEAIAQGVNPDCFSRKPACFWKYLTDTTCEEQDSGAKPFAHLSELNKCNWGIINHYNWMDQEIPKGQGINSFDHKMISIENGYLNLRAEKNSISKNEIDCKNDYVGSDPAAGDVTKICPIISGGILSRPGTNFPGFDKLYGRFEVRAKLPEGPGSWPAHWLLPTTGYWPSDGEIDIMESWSDNRDQVSGAFHTQSIKEPKKVELGASYKAKNNLYPNLNFSERKRTFYRDFHLYAVEWDESQIRWFVDDNLYFTIDKFQMIKGVEFKFPNQPFYFILNSTIAPFKGSSKKFRPDLEKFVLQNHYIDYVRVYDSCDLGDGADPNCKKLLSPSNARLDCPKPRKKIGEFSGKAVCEAIPNIKWSLFRCQKNKKWNVWNEEWCIKSKGKYYTARSLKSAGGGQTGEAAKGCGIRKKLGEEFGYNVCEAIPNLKIKKSKCKGKKTLWDNDKYCITFKNGFYTARSTK